MHTVFSKPQLRLALLIDAENIKQDYAPFIIALIEAYGQPVIKRAYANWKKHSAWFDNLHKYNISAQPVTPVNNYKN